MEENARPKGMGRQWDTFTTTAAILQVAEEAVRCQAPTKASWVSTLTIVFVAAESSIFGIFVTSAIVL